MRPRGRFAPSPTGSLHFGSLVAAVASFADARARGGDWLVRMEDLDRPRELPGAAERILAGLIAFGMTWDGEVVRQSTRDPAYQAALTALERLDLVYPCACTRAEIARLGRRGPEGPVYPGTCRAGLPPGRSGRALRLRADGPSIHWQDLVRGEREQQIAESVGDFVVRRADGLFAYQLAVVVDDAHQGITHVVRGGDLVDSTPRQILIQRALGLPTPVYAHVPLILGPDGHKLSKSLGALPVDPGDPLPGLRLAWRALGQAPLPDASSVGAFWRLAIPAWCLHRVPGGDIRLGV
jgi:glutamyl-Q tRNA(Asp) synthetase